MITQIWTETLANDNVVFKDTDRTSHCAPLNSINHYPVIGHGVERYQISIQPLETIETVQPRFTTTLHYKPLYSDPKKSCQSFSY